MKLRLIPLALSATLLIGAPVAASAQAAASKTAAAPAKQGSASKLVLDSSSRIIGTLEKRRPEFRKSPAALKSYVDSEFNRVFDRNYAARLVLGVHGRGADEAEVKAFADAMAENLMARYGSSLLDFNTKLRVRVKSESALPNGRGVKVSSELLRDNGAPVPIDYLMRNAGGEWKVFDVMIEGISYVQTFKNQFDAPLRKKSIRQVADDLRKGTLQAGGN